MELIAIISVIVAVLSFAYLVIFGQKSIVEFLDWLRERREDQTKTAKSESLLESKSFPRLTAPLPVTEDLPNGRHIDDLLKAAGYRITDTKKSDTNLLFWCKSTHGSEAVVYFVNGDLLAGDIAALNDAVSGKEERQGILLTHHPLPQKLHSLVCERRNIEHYTLNKFTDHLIDFRPYLQQLIQEYEASDQSRFYVPLNVCTKMGEVQPVEDFIETWLHETGRNHLSLIGKYGSGKTWLCWRYAYLAAKRYLDAPTHNRIPILISLHSYHRFQKVESLAIHALTERHISSVAGYKTFDWLNQSGRLLLILDGFDEMQPGDEVSSAAEGFEQLSTLVHPQSKVLLTCRIEDLYHRGEQKEAIAPKTSEVSIVIGDEVINLRGRQGYEMAEICDWAEESIQQALQKRRPIDWRRVYAKLQEQRLSHLADLAKRPMLLDMIAELPEQKVTADVNLVTLYQNYLDSRLKQLNEDVKNLSFEERLFLMQELAWVMYINPAGRLRTVPFAKVLESEHVIARFDLNDNPARSAFLERDLSTRSCLIHDGKGNYRFVHKSFGEYYVAYKMAEALRELDSNLANVIEVWKSRRLSPVVQDFLVDMIAEDTLFWRLIEATRGRTEEEVNYAGGNAATVLWAKECSFRGCDLSGTMLKGATLTKVDFHEARLVKTDLSEANLEQTDFTESLIDNIKVTNANVRGVRPENQRDKLRKAGAVMERYDSRFGQYFALSQADFLGGTYIEAFEVFLSMIRTTLTDDDLMLDLMSGGGDVVEALLKERPNLKIVMTDRNKEMLDRIDDAGDFPNLERVRCELPKEVAKIPYQGKYSVIAGKKWLHEIPFEQQADLVRQIVTWLAPGGRMFLWLDGAAFITPEVRKNILNAKQLTAFEDVLQIPIQQSKAGISEFVNLWVFVKDWYNDNMRERDRRYFVSKQEVIEYLKAAGTSVTSTRDEFYNRANPSNFNERAKRAKLAGDEAQVQASLVDPAFQVFCEFTEKHLFKERKRTILGELLDAQYVEQNGREFVEFSISVVLLEAEKRLEG